MSSYVICGIDSSEMSTAFGLSVICVFSVITTGWFGAVETIANLSCVSPPGIPPKPIWLKISFMSPPNKSPKPSDAMSFRR